LRSLFVFAAALLLLGAFCSAQGDEDAGKDGDGYGDGDGDGDGDGYGDGGGDGYGDGDGDGDGGGSHRELQELKSLSDFESFIDNAEASIICTLSAEKTPDPESKRPPDWDDDEDGEWEAPTIESPHLVSLKSISSIVMARFAYTTAPEVLAKIKFKPGQFLAGLYLFRSPWYVSKDHDRARERYTSDTLTQEGVQHWIDTKAQPLVGEFNSDTEHRYTSPVLIIFMHLDFKESPKPVNYVLRRARKVASSLTGKLAFAVASHENTYDLDDYGIDSMKGSEIRMAIREGPDSTAAKYAAPVDTKFSGDSLSNFAMAYLAGKLTAYKKPESKDLGADKDEM